MIDTVSTLSGVVGLIGAVTGIISLIEVRKIKSLDLRIERGRLLNSIQVGLDNLSELGHRANKSRINRLAAQGLSQSGSMQKWREDFETNKQVISGLMEKFSTFKKSKIIGNSLETHILELHLIEEQIKSLASGFVTTIAEDDVARDRLVRMRVGA